MILRNFRIIWRNEKHKKFLEMWKKGFSPLNFDADDLEHVIKIAIRLLIRYRNIEYRISSSGRGMHFRVVDENGNEIYLPSKLVLQIRKNIGDDPGRIYWDSLKLKYGKWRPISVLFDSKNGRKTSEWKKLTLKELIDFIIEKYILNLREINYGSI